MRPASALPVRRLNLRVASMMFAGALGGLRDDEGKPTFITKGGSPSSCACVTRARATQDIDAVGGDVQVPARRRRAMEAIGAGASRVRVDGVHVTDCLYAESPRRTVGWHYIVRVMARGHRTVELQSIEMHRLVAGRINDALLDGARRRVVGWLDAGGPVPPRAAGRWLALLDGPLPELRRALVADTEEMRDLRQSTPFAGALDEKERLRVLRSVG